MQKDKLTENSTAAVDMEQHELTIRSRIQRVRTSPLFRRVVGVLFWAYLIAMGFASSAQGMEVRAHLPWLANTVLAPLASRMEVQVIRGEPYTDQGVQKVGYFFHSTVGATLDSESYGDYVIWPCNDPSQWVGMGDQENPLVSNVGFLATDTGCYVGRVRITDDAGRQQIENDGEVDPRHIVAERYFYFQVGQ